MLYISFFNLLIPSISIIDIFDAIDWKNNLSRLKSSLSYFSANVIAKAQASDTSSLPVISNFFLLSILIFIQLSKKMIKISFSFKKQIQYKYLANIQKLKFYKNIKKIIKNNFF